MKNQQKHPKEALCVPAKIIVLIIVITLLYIARFLYISSQTRTLNWKENNSYFFDSKISQELPKETDEAEQKRTLKIPSLYIFYRIGCPYCNGAHEAIQEQYSALTSKQKEHVAFVNVETEMGHELVIKYNVSIAHTIVYVDKNNNHFSYDENESKHGKDLVKPNNSQIVKLFKLI